MQESDDGRCMDCVVDNKDDMVKKDSGDMSCTETEIMDVSEKEGVDNKDDMVNKNSGHMSCTETEIMDVSEKEGNIEFIEKKF